MKLQGDARTRALVEGARRESGDIMVYTDADRGFAAVLDAFTRKYGIKVRNWRSSSENVVQRIISETRAGRREVDFIENIPPRWKRCGARRC